jgi:hypothetical protein
VLQIGRTRPPRVPAPFGFKDLKLIAALGAITLLTLLFTDVEPLATTMILIGLLLGTASLVIQFIRHKQLCAAYRNVPGALINDYGLTLYDDGGPTLHPWKNFGEVFVSSLHGLPIIQHLSVDDLHREGYDRYSSYLLTSIDYLAIKPDELVDILRSHPGFPRESAKT